MRSVSPILAGVLAAVGVAEVRAGEPPAKPPAKPLTSKDLVGTWLGERDGVKVELTVKANGEARWRVERAIPGGRYHAQADLRAVDDPASGEVELRFHRRVEPPVVLVGRVARRPGGVPTLTIPTESEQYPTVKDLPLEPVRDGGK